MQSMKDKRETNINFYMGMFYLKYFYLEYYGKQFKCLSYQKSLILIALQAKYNFNLVLYKIHVVFITLTNLTASSYLHFLILHEFSSRLRTNLLHRRLSFRDLFHKVFVHLQFSVAPQSDGQYIDNSHEDIVGIHFQTEFLGDGRQLEA